MCIFSLFKLQFSNKFKRVITFLFLSRSRAHSALSSGFRSGSLFTYKVEKCKRSKINHRYLGSTKYRYKGLCALNLAVYSTTPLLPNELEGNHVAYKMNSFILFIFFSVFFVPTYFTKPSHKKCKNPLVHIWE